MLLPLADGLGCLESQEAEGAVDASEGEGPSGEGEPRRFDGGLLYELPSDPLTFLLAEGLGQQEQAGPLLECVMVVRDPIVNPRDLQVDSLVTVGGFTTTYENAIQAGLLSASGQPQGQPPQDHQARHDEQEQDETNIGDMDKAEDAVPMDAQAEGFGVRDAVFHHPPRNGGRCQAYCTAPTRAGRARDRGGFWVNRPGGSPRRDRLCRDRIGSSPDPDRRSSPVRPERRDDLDAWHAPPAAVRDALSPREPSHDRALARNLSAPVEPSP